LNSQRSCWASLELQSSGGAWAPPTTPPAALGLTPSGSEAPFLPRYSSADGEPQRYQQKRGGNHSTASGFFFFSF